MNKINLELRFDVLTIVGDENDIPVIEYLEDAFNPMLVY